MVRIRRKGKKKQNKTETEEIKRIYCASCSWVTEHLYQRDDANKRDIYKCRICGTEQTYYDSRRKQDYDKLGYNGSGGI